MNGETGYLVPVGDEAAMAESVLRILRDDDLREEMARRSHAWIETEFSLKRLVDKMHIVYREVHDETARSITTQR
jgi:glycosyltransferase involved in cell wall biosynthesis